MAKGRPRRDVVDSVASRVWYTAVLGRSGLKTSYQLERLFSNDSFHKGKDRQTVRPCQWDKYRRGDVSPSQATLQKVEALLPGTKKWFDLTLWDMIKDAPPSREKLKLAISLSRPKIAQQVVPDGPDVRRSPLFDYRTIASLWIQGDVDALTTLFGAVREAELRMDKAQFVESIVACLHVVVVLMTEPPFSYARDALFSHLSHRFFRRIVDYPPVVLERLGNADDCAEALKQSLSEAEQFGLIKKTRRDRAYFAYCLYRKGLIKNAVSVFSFSTTPDVVITQLEKMLKGRKRVVPAGSSIWFSSRFRSRDAAMSRHEINLLVETPGDNQHWYPD